MPEALTRYNWYIYLIKLVSVVSVEIGTTGLALISLPNLPPFARWVVILSALKAAGAFSFGFFSDNGSEKK